MTMWQLEMVDKLQKELFLAGYAAIVYIHTNLKNINLYLTKIIGYL